MSIRELARHLNVSIGTVSRALNGKADVSAETRQRVLAAADAFGYSPNQSGRSLRQGSTGMIALMIPTNTKMPLVDTIFMAVLEGLRSFLADRNLDLMVLLGGPEENAYAYLRRVAERRMADGIIITETQRRDPRIDYLIEKHIPFVAFGRSLSGGTHPWIDLDFEHVAASAVARFVGHGHRRIALATSSSQINYGHVFAEAYRSALIAAGIPIDPEIIFRVENSEDGGYDLGGKLADMADRPTAVLLVNEMMSVGLYRGLTERGLRPGRDVSVIAFQEEPNGRFLTPKVTCFRSPLADLGKRLGQALLASIPAYAEAAGGRPIQEIWPMELVQGESDGPPNT